MKRLLSVCLLSALTVISVCAAKQRVTVHGVAPQGAETITVFDGGTGRPLGPALAVKDGQFTYNATVTDPTYVMFYHPHCKITIFSINLNSLSCTICIFKPILISCINRYCRLRVRLSGIICDIFEINNNE